MNTRLNIYSIFDNLTGEFGPLFEAKTHDLAVKAVNEIEFPSHFDFASFELFCLGRFETDGEALMKDENGERPSLCYQPRFIFPDLELIGSLSVLVGEKNKSEVAL